MSASILHPYQWNTDSTQYFLTVNPNGDELGLYESTYQNKQYTLNKITTTRPEIPSRSERDSIQCYNYSPTEPGLVGSGLLSGTILLSNIKNNSKVAPVRLRQKQQRPCNSLSFSSQGYLAVALDKVRNDSSLQIFDINRVFQGDKAATYSLLANEVVSSVSFLPDSQVSLICGSYKFLREYDVRYPSPNFEVATKYVHGVTIDPFNNNYFSTHTDNGLVAFWDRRKMHTGSSGSSEPLLTVNPIGELLRGKNTFPCFRISSTRRGEFSILNEGHSIKRWQTGYVPPHLEPQPLLQSQSQTGAQNSPQSQKFHQSLIMKPEYLFVSSVMQSATLHDFVTSFDYVADLEHPHKLNFICIRKSGEVFRMKATEGPTAIRFDPFNTVASADREHITFFGPSQVSSSNSPKIAEFQPLLARRFSTASTQSIGDSSSESGSNDTDYDRESSRGDENEPFSSSAATLRRSLNNAIYKAEEVLEGDISFTIRKLAINNYSMNCEDNLTLLNTFDYPNNSRLERLVAAWKWVNRSQRSRRSMISGLVDLSYEGVLGIWEGYNWIAKKVNNPKFTPRDFETAITRILEGSKRKIFTAWTSSSQAKRDLRQLCLRVAGWNFEISQLETLLKQLEAEGKYEQAAGWAVFHGNVNRAVESLAASKNDRLRIMSAAIAGYDGYKSTTRDTKWKALCRDMASDLENPYMRAVFAFIADGDWGDVLYETSLPLHERLGIALRFLPDDELSAYLYALTRQVISDGDIDGVILTGITSRAVDLFQSYVDKTADVQTASLIISFASPLYFQDERATHWIECYRNLLNSWKLFAKRSMFDVARTRASRTFEGRITANIVPRQVYLLCHNCKKVIGNNLSGAGGSGLPVTGGPATGATGGGDSGGIVSGSGGVASPAQRQESMSGSPTAPVINMKEPFPQNRHLASQIKLQGTDTNIRCPHCNYPLPRCAVCLLPLGSMPPRMNHDNSLKALQNLVSGTNNSNSNSSNNNNNVNSNHTPNDSSKLSTVTNANSNTNTNEADGNDKTKPNDNRPNENSFDRFFVFCLSCNHGMHAGHAREWFAKHSLCAVPDCDCSCNQYNPY